MLEEFFRVHVRRAEGLLRFTARRLVGCQQLILAANHAHAATAPTRGSLQYQGIPDARRFFRKLFLAFDDAVAPRDGRQAGGFHFPARAVLLSHHFDDFRPWTDEGDFGSFTNFGEIGVLAQEAIPRMDGVDVGNFRGANHLWNVQIALAAAGRANAHRFIGKSNVERVTIRLGIYRNGGNAELLAGANDPQGDFPAIGD